jgi:hypothetical protein
MDAADPGLAATAAVACSLLGGSVEAIDRVHGGGRNSRVYRVRRGAEYFAVKQYPSPHEDPRDRLKTEFGALELMERHGITAVPRPLATDAERGYALLSWIEGKPVEIADEGDIAAVANFLGLIHRLRCGAEAPQQPLAAEACLSGAEIVAQLGRRLARLGSAASADPALAEFLDRTAGWLFATILPKTMSGYEPLGLSFVLPLPGECRSLCPSDFGFHNALRDATGLAFLDFEYFGWDDPVKLTCDFLLHPGMCLSDSLKQRFAAAALGIYGADPTFARRLSLLYPLFAVRWCLILLNEFLPERWAHRVHAGVELDWAKAKRQQLVLANELLLVVQSNGGDFPYGN